MTGSEQVGVGDDEAIAAAERDLCKRMIASTLEMACGRPLSDSECDVAIEALERLAPA